MIRNGLIYVKPNGEYSYYNEVPPTVSDNESAGYATGETWLDLLTGLSYKLTDATLGLWVQIEQSLDNRISYQWDGFFHSISRNLNQRFPVFLTRTACYIERGGTIGDIGCHPVADYPAGNREISGEWTINDDTLITDSTVGVIHMVPNPGDVVALRGFQSGNGFYEVISYDLTDGIVTIILDRGVTETVGDLEWTGVVGLSVIPVDYLRLVGEMLHYDLSEKQKTSPGMQSETIGKYSYTTAMNNQRSQLGLHYPDSVMSRLQQYNRLAIGGV